MNTLVMHKWVVALTVLFGISTIAYANAADKRISLGASAAFASAKGKAKYRDRGGEREFQVEVENLRLAAGTTVNIFVGNTKVGSARVSTLRAARFNVNSTSGAAVPRIVAGSRVTVKTTAGATIVSGQF